VKIRQQKELSESIIVKIQKELENPKVLQQILQQSITDVEREYLHIYLLCSFTNSIDRNRCIQSTIDEERIEEQTEYFPLSNLLCHSRTSIFSQASRMLIVLRADYVTDAASL